MTNRTSEVTAVLPIAEEEIEVSKREAIRGKVRVQVVTDTEEERISTELDGEDVEVRHIPVNRYVEPGAEIPKVRDENGVLIIPVLEEVVIVEKRLLIKEELHIHRHPTKEVTEVPVSLRRQRAIVERLDSDGNSIPDTAKSNMESDS